MKHFTNKIIHSIKKSIEYQEDPKNRRISEVEFIINDNSTASLLVTSDCDSFAETTRVLFTTSRRFDESEKSSIIGMTELEFFTKYYIDDLEELIRSLEILYNSDRPISYEYDSTYFNTNEDDFADYVEGLCCGLLITNSGSCNFCNIRKLKDRGYDVFAGEKDSFGWLTGCVQKHDDDRILVYG